MSEDKDEQIAELAEHLRSLEQHLKDIWKDIENIIERDIRLGLYSREFAQAKMKELFAKGKVGGNNDKR